MNQVPIIKFMFQEEWKVLSDAAGIAPAYTSESFSSADELTKFLGTNSAGMVVTSLRDKNDLIQLATLLKITKKLVPNTLVKVIVVNFSGDKQYEKAIAKMGIMDVVEGRIPTKALRFKIDFMMKSVNVHLKKLSDSSASAANVVKNTEAQKIAQDKKVSESTPIWLEALANENDIWLLKNETDCKKVLTRWLIKLMGPSPYVAQWTETKQPDIWKFEFKSERETYIPGEGNWFFRGDQKPDFIWTENLWSFTGASFELFYRVDLEVSSRVLLKEKQLSISKNSEYAKTKEQDILDSFDKDLVLKKEMTGKVQTKMDKEPDKFQNLEGKGKTDFIADAPLSGKSQTDSENHKPLSGKGQTDSLNPKPLTGKGQTSHLNLDPMSLDIGSQKKSDEELSLETSTGHEKFLKNHNEAEKFDKKGFGGTIKKEGVSGNLEGEISDQEAAKEPLKGKSATDKLKNSPLSGFISNDDFEETAKTKSPVNPKLGSKSPEKVVEINSSKKEFSLKESRDSELLEETDQEFQNTIETAKVTSVLIQDMFKMECHLDDYFDETIIFTTNWTGFIQDKDVTLDLNFNYMKKDVVLKLQGMISQIDSDEEQTQYISVLIAKENITAFNSYMKMFGVRQENINLFLKTVKGQ